MRKDHYTQLKDSVLVGYVDHLDVVHCYQYIRSEDDSYSGGPPTHEDQFGKVLKGWRWDFDRGLDWSVFAKNLDEGDGDRVKDFLTRKYKIPFYANGFHDVQFFVEKLEEERKNK